MRIAIERGRYGQVVIERYGNVADGLEIRMFVTPTRLEEFVVGLFEVSFAV